MLQLEHPEYIAYLQEESYFDDVDFLLYLRHLHYWKRPEYLALLSSVRQVKCIHIL